MVFESIVADLLNRFLGDYVENLDRSQLKIGIWGGDVVLNDLILKQSALNELDLPVKTVCGRLGKLTLKIPWKNLYTAPVEACIERLFILVVPNNDVKYDAAKEEKYKQEAKQKELQRIDKAKQADKGMADKQSDTFVEKLATQIIRNVQICIKDIHLRYEDRVTCPSQPFSLGFTLHLLSVQTTDNQWKPCIVQDSEPRVHKFVDLVGLAVYWNCSRSFFLDCTDKEKMEMFQQGIASRNYLPPGYTYLLGPIDSSAQLTLIPRPEILEPKYSEPKVHLKVDMRELILGIGKYQYQDMIQLLDAFERMGNAARYRKYRPPINVYRGHYKEWWHFAYESIVKEDVRRIRQNWDWKHIRNHRSLCRKYAEAYGAMLLNPDGKLKAVIEECEMALDVFNITLLRQKTELEVGRKMIKEEERKASQGWFSGWWGNGKKKPSQVNQESSASDIVSQFEVAMTGEERQKLYRAIGYGEGTASPELYPPTFVEYNLAFTLSRLVIEVWQNDDIECGSTSKTSPILHARMSGVKFDVQRRPVSALRLVAGISRLDVSGCPTPGGDGSAPLLVAPTCQQLQSHPSSADKPSDELLHILFETEPIDGTCDRRLQVRAAPLHIVYDAVTVDSVLSVFRPPQGVALERLRAAALSGIEEIKEKSAMGLQHTIEHHKQLDLEINIMSSRILIPQDGTLSKDAALLVINLGGLSMRSVPQVKRMLNINQLVNSGANEEEILKEMFQYSYDQFIMELRDMQVLMVCNQEDWESVVGGNSRLHLLHPLALEVRIFLCLIADDPRLPKVKVDARLPPVHIRFSDERLLSLAHLLQSFPIPGQEQEENLPPLDTCSLASSMYNVSELGAIGARIAPACSLQSPSTPTVMQSTLTELTFQANEISVSVGREVDPVDVYVVEFRLDSLESQVKQRTYDLSVALHVGSVSLKHGVLGCNEPVHMLSVVDGGDETAKGVKKQHLLSILFMQVSDKSPDFQTEWKSVERSLNVHLTGVILAVHAEAVMALKDFIENLLQGINEDDTSQKKINELAPPCPSRAASTLNINIPSGRKKRHRINPELIHLKLDAHLEQFGISCHVAAHDGPLMRFDIKAMNASTIVRETRTECKASLGSIHTVDLSPKTIHKEVVHPLAGKTLVVEVVMWADGGRGGNKDLQLRVMLGRVQFVFLNRFISTLMGFINNFQATKEALVRASANAAEVAKQNVKEAYAQAMRIALDVKVEAPIIVIPTDSQSRDAIILDLGVLSIKNAIRTLPVKDDEGNPATLDEIHIDLQNLKMTRVKLPEKGSDLGKEWTLIEPISFGLKLQRNLSSAWYTEEPEIEISGHLGSISISLCEGDMDVIRRVSIGNLNETSSLENGEMEDKTLAVNQMEEGGPLRPDSLHGLEGLKIESPTEKLDTADKIVETPTTPPIILVSMRLAFVMDNLKIDLHRGDHKEEGIENGLAHLEFGLLSLRGCMLSDSSASLSLRLMNCLMEDSRCERGAIIRLLCAGASLGRSFKCLDPSKGVLDITVQRKSDDTFADIRVFGFELVLCPQYLTEVSAFFTGGEEVQKGVPPSSSQQQTQPTASSESTPSSSGSIHLNLRVESPDIVLVADTYNIDTEALLLQGEIEMRYRLTSNHWTINGSLENIRLLACQYNPDVGGKSAVEVLRPCNLNIAGSTPEGMGAHVEVSLSDLCLSVFPGTIALLSKVYNSLSAPPSDSSVEGLSKENDWTGVWLPKKFVEDDYWFLKTEVGEDAVLDISSAKDTSSCYKSELMLFSAPSVRVAFEAGLGGRALPLLLLQTSFQGKICDWNSKMRVESSLRVQMEYYNGGLAVWEPIIETVEVVQKDGQSKREPWELCLEVESGGEECTQILSPNSDDLEEIKLPQPNLTASLSSKDNLEITVTKTFLDVIYILGKAFQNALDEGAVSSSTPAAPYLVQNDLGIPVNLILKGTPFQVPMSDTEDETRGCIREIRLQSGAHVSLEKSRSKSTGGDPFNSADDDLLSVEVLGETPSVEGIGGSWKVDVPVARAERRHFSLRRHQGESWSLVSEVCVENGNKVVTLRSAVQVVNELREPAEVYYMTPRGNEVERVGGPLAPGDVLNLPLFAIHSPTAELFFRVEKSTVSIVPFVWKELQRMPTFSSILRCDPKEGGSPVFIQVIGETERIPHERTGKHTLSSVCHRVYLRPTVILRNLLPINILVTQSLVHGEHSVMAGNDITLPSACPGACSLVIKIPNYLEREWSCLEDIMLNQPELSVWYFESHDAMQGATLDLGMHAGKSKGTLELSLFAPCWMVNKTGFLLTYRAVEDSSNMLYHPPDLNIPILFAPKGKAFFGKKKALVRIDDGDWSTSFSLDAVGSSGIVSCSTSSFTRQLGVHVQLTGCSLTKRVIFMPRVVLMNNANYDLECREEGRSADPWVYIPSGGCIPFWPHDTNGKLVVRVVGTMDTTAPFPLGLVNPTLLPLTNQYGGVQVEVQTTEGATYITFGPYKPGLAPALIVNHHRKPIEFWEKGSKNVWTLMPSQQCLLAWSDPSGPRNLCWKGCSGKEVSDGLTEDALGEVGDSDSGGGYWVSFLDGMQRVLLFTDDVALAQEARTAGELEAASMDLSISLHGLGLSLVDDSKALEILHAGIVSSGVLWEVQKSGGKRFRALPARESMALEKGYQKYLGSTQADEATQVQIDNKTVVDFNLMMMERPHRRHLRRSFLTGLWLEMQTSPHGRTIHAKINRLQIDCQLPDSVFPTVFAPVPPPKSIATDSAPKPFVELSIVQRLNEHSTVQQFKYFKILVQEFHVKLDIGFLNALLSLPTTDVGLGVYDKMRFKNDLELLKEPLEAYVSLRSSEEQKNFYDLLHFSPLKMHLSFSLSQSSSGGSNANGIQSAFLNVLLQSIGVTLTDVQDVVFRLSYFERKGVFLNGRQLVQEVSMHYVGQSLKQLYVLVLGLDVIGNPFGLVLGLTRGVEDLFYEPIQGAVQGPGEFAEGLVLGVRSLFGHTVGGAAGAASRIAGTLGKGIAALSFDPEFQRRRREQMGRHPTNLQEGLARGGRGLVTGVVDGVSGVFLKPISGAMEEGFGGFLKGMGKGVVGLVARPTAGVVDFAGGSLDAVRRAAELSEQVSRLRLPRFLVQGGPVRSFALLEAEGDRLLRELERGRYASTDKYAYHARITSGVVLLTDKRIIFLHHNDVFGQWQSVWEHTWSEMGDSLHSVDGGIFLMTPKRKVLGLFGGGEHGRVLTVPDGKLKTVILGKMEELYKNAK